MVRAISRSVCYIVGDVIASGGKPNRAVEIETDAHPWFTQGSESRWASVLFLPQVELSFHLLREIFVKALRFRGSSMLPLR